MKLKSNVITAIIVVSFLVGMGTTIQAQGIYSTDKQPESTDSPQATDDNKPKDNGGGGLFRSDDGDWGDGGDDGDPQPGGEVPIGGGIVILSLLSGGYALVKRNVRNRHED